MVNLWLIPKDTEKPIDPRKLERRKFHEQARNGRKWNRGGVSIQTH